MPGTVPIAKPAAQRLAYTIDEAITLVPVSKSTIFRLIATGELATVTVRGRRLVPHAALAALVSGDVA